MAIGSAPEIGTQFKPCRDYTMADWEQWWAYIRTNWAGNIQAGYATVVHDKNNRFYRTADEQTKG